MMHAPDKLKRIIAAAAVCLVLGIGITVGICIGASFALEERWTDVAQGYASVATAGMSFISIVLWGVYVILTRDTLLEIERQTELQIEAFLVVQSQVLPQSQCPDSDKIDAGAMDLHARWHERLKRNMPKAVEGSVADRFLRLTLKNRGKSDVMSWTLSVRMTVSTSPELVALGITANEPVYEWKIDNKDGIEQNDSVNVTVAAIGAFPNVHIGWSVSYVDSRGKASERCGGTPEKIDRNLIAAPVHRP